MRQRTAPAFLLRISSSVRFPHLAARITRAPGKRALNAQLRYLRWRRQHAAPSSAFHSQFRPGAGTSRSTQALRL